MAATLLVKWMSAVVSSATFRLESNSSWTICLCSKTRVVGGFTGPAFIEFSSAPSSNNTFSCGRLTDVMYDECLTGSPASAVSGFTLSSYTDIGFTVACFFSLGVSCNRRLRCDNNIKLSLQIKYLLLLLPLASQAYCYKC